MHLQKYCKLIYPDTTIILNKDTIMYIYEGDSIKIRQRRLVRVFNELFRIDPNAGRDSLEFIQASKHFKKYKGKIIGDITIKRIEIFGTSLYDTSLHAENWLAKAGNTIHIDTREKEIRHNLLIKKGQKISPPKIADNERIIRNLPYISDARIVVYPRKDSDTADILIITRDQWTLDPDISLGLIQTEIGLEENNFLGLGHQFSNTLFLRTRNQPIGYEGVYRVQNLFGSFLTGRLQYTNIYQKIIYEVAATREFLSADVQHAGGLTFRRKQLEKARYYSLQDSVNFLVHSFVEDAWYGRSFEVVHNKEDDYRSRSSIILAGRIANENFTRRPIIDRDTNRFYQNNTLFVGSISFSQRDYYKGNFIFGFGRTEDVPHGRLFQLTLGFRRGEMFNSGYFGLSAARGALIKKVGYFNVSAAWGTFFSPGRLEEGVLALKGLYFTDLYKLRKFQFRWIARTNYTYGINQAPEDYLELIDINGLRGVTSRELRGNQRFGFSAENVIFTPWYILGFRVGLFYYLDMGYITNNKQFVWKSRPYYGLGAGIRIRNENFTIPAFELSIAVYPSPPLDQFFFGFDAGGQSELQANDFDVKAPGPVDFK
jgi:hypothetical protein